jgi:hypothetical protein
LVPVRVGVLRQAAAFAVVALLAVPVGTAAAHFAGVDQSNNYVDWHFGRDLLDTLEPNALLLMRGDVVTMAVEYQQAVEHYRTDVVAMDMEKLKLEAYVNQQRRAHPDVVIPFNAYDEGQNGASLRLIIDQELPRRPVYLLGNPKEKDFGGLYEAQKAGLTNKVLPLGSGQDVYQFMRERVPFFMNLHYPERQYPYTTFESALTEVYGRVAADVAFVIDDDTHPADAETMYKRAIFLDPKNPYPYKNLGLLLLKTSSVQEVREAAVKLWEYYLQLNPGDPEGPAMQRNIAIVRGQQPAN